MTRVWKIGMVCLGVAGWLGSPALFGQIAHLQGEMAGEVTAESVILHTRLTAAEKSADGNVPAAAGVGRFELSVASEGFEPAIQTPWISTDVVRDGVIQVRVSGLKSGTMYRYRLVFGIDADSARPGPVRSFRTLPGSGALATTRFVVVTGMNYSRFHLGKSADRPLGYPALAAIRKAEPDFFIGTGDNVYYDHPASPAAQTPEQMRKKWHEQLVQPRYVELFSTVPTYWEKDDHDHRYNDSDNAGNRKPSSEDGIRIFKEQVPVTDPADSEAVTYRTHRVSRLLQIWLLEGRDYRSPNALPDGPDKTIWGTQQWAWLQQTLGESDAPFKLVISPTPMVGPDDARKKDNHTNPGGFRHEGNAFFKWLGDQGFLNKGLFLICGDRHWQYHSMHPSGFEEFSSGALVDENSRLGPMPGDPKSTDPDAKIRQPFVSPEPTGGYLQVEVAPDAAGQAVCRFIFCDDLGRELYRVEKRQPIGK